MSGAGRRAGGRGRGTQGRLHAGSASEIPTNPPEAKELLKCGEGSPLIQSPSRGISSADKTGLEKRVCFLESIPPSSPGKIPGPGRARRRGRPGTKSHQGLALLLLIFSLPLPNHFKLQSCFPQLP